MNEQEETELQVLQSIFEDDLQIISERMYRAILRPDAHITLGLDFDCRNTDYPNTIPNITITLLKGKIIPMYKQYLQHTLTDAAREKQGLPMMFDLIELAKYEIEVNDLTQGSVGILVPDILVRIFELLNYRDLTACGVVSKKWKQITSYDEIWRTRCLNFQRQMPELEISKKEGVTYRDYFPTLRKQFLKQLPMEYSYVLSIHSGQRTCEEFAELSPTNFINYFFDYMKFAAALEMTNEKQFIFTNYSRFMSQGSLRLMTVDQAAKYFDTSPWFYRALTLHKELNCPYVGPVVGFVAIYFTRLFTERMRKIFPFSRGIIANSSLPSYSECVVVKAKHKFELEGAQNAVHFIPTNGILHVPLTEDLNGTTKYCIELKKEILKDNKGSKILTEFWFIDESVTNTAEITRGSAASSSFEEFAQQLIGTIPANEKQINYN